MSNGLFLVGWWCIIGSLLHKLPCIRLSYKSSKSEKTFLMVVFILPTKFTTANSTQQCFFSHFLRGIPGKKYCWAAKGEAALKLLAFFTPSPLFATFVLLRVSGHRAYTTRLTTKNPDGLGHFFSSNCILHFYGVFYHISCLIKISNT